MFIYVIIHIYFKLSFQYAYLNYPLTVIESCYYYVNFFKFMEEWPLTVEETDAVLEFWDIASQFFDTATHYVDLNEQLAIAGPSTHTNQGVGLVLSDSAVDDVSVPQKYRNILKILKLNYFFLFNFQSIPINAAYVEKFLRTWRVWPHT